MAKDRGESTKQQPIARLLPIEASQLPCYRCGETPTFFAVFSKGYVIKQNDKAMVFCQECAKKE
jgi:hypothetical protein